MQSHESQNQVELPRDRDNDMLPKRALPLYFNLGGFCSGSPAQH